jgi:hypothetical protein
MTIDWALVVEVIKAVAWPLVAAFALYLLRHPIVELAGEIARRARKVSAFDVSVELAALPELRTSWSVGPDDVRQLTSANIFDSPSDSLFQELLRPTQADYAIVDIGAGRAWLTSRLFIFALILSEATGLRAFVFLESAAGIRRRFLGVATAVDVRRRLGMRYPWLEEAYARALAAGYAGVIPQDSPGVSKFSNSPSLFAAGEPSGLKDFVRRFLDELQRSTLPPPDELASHLEVETVPQTWERTNWIDGERLERDLVGVLEYAWLEASPDTPLGTVAETIIRRTGPFVALVDSDRRFKGLIDRHALSDLVSARRDSPGQSAPANASKG